MLIRPMITAFALAPLLMLSSPAQAQEAAPMPVPAVEVSAGYAFLRDFSDFPGDTNFPAGWFAGAGVSVNRWFGIVGEVGGSYTGDLRYRFAGPGDGFGRRLEESLRFKYRIFSLMAGPRFSFASGRVVPFVQVLAGGIKLRTEVSVLQPVDGMRPYSRTENLFAVQPGGGLTFYLSERIGLRFAADHRLVVDFFDDGNEYDNELRAAAGFVFGWGAR